MGLNSTPNQSSCMGRLLLGLIFLWIHAVILSAQLFTWSSLVFGLSNVTLGPTLGQAFLVGLPLALLAWLWKEARGRAIFLAWLLATGYLLLLTPARLLDPAQSQWLLFSQLLLSLLYLVFLGLLLRPNFISSSAGPAQMLLAVGLAILVTYPWLALGALGSLLDTLLALALGLVAGLNVGMIVGWTWLRHLNSQPGGRGRDIFTGGLVIGVAVLIMASGLTFNGLQIFLMLALPGLGWIAMALSYARPSGEGQAVNGYSWRPPALLLGLVIAAVIALTDTDSLALIALDPALGWAFRTALVTMVFGWLLAAVALLARSWWGRALNSGLVGGGVILLGLAGLGLYLAVGQPGFYGDRLFLLLEDQADLSGAAGMVDYDDRRQFVYERLTGHANQSQQELRSYLDLFGLDYRPYYLVNAIEIEGGLLVRLLLLPRSEVDRIIPSPVLRPLPAALPVERGGAAPPRQPQWNLTNIGADRVWNEFGVRGAGIVIGQSDSGVQLDHPELQARYRGRDGRHDYNWLDPWAGTSAPVDYGGHGTHTLGSVLGQSVGVAPEAEWFACANLRRNLGNPALYLDCMQFMLAPYPQEGDPFTDGDPTRSAHVLNNSWGCPESHEGCDPNSLRPAVEALRAAGIFVVASAGNDGPACGTIRDPLAIYDAAFSVGAVDEKNNLAVFSSTGPVTVDGSGRTKPDIVAPGVDVLSAYPGSTYTLASGTSMAGPHVAGVVALIWSANPALIGDIDRTEQILIETATPFTGAVGGIDPQQAMEELVGEDAAEQLLENSDPDQLAAGNLAPGSCLAQTNLGNVPNRVAGYGVVNAYEAVKQALAE